jgi:hypothetical protein
MNFETVMRELEALGKERLKKNYRSRGAREPLFGVATGEMKPMAKLIKRNQELAEQLYATGNYDAMYFAGVIAEPQIMKEADFERWMDSAYFYMLSDYVVAVTLSESELAQAVSDQWIASGEELRMSAGWSCYCWLLGNRVDEYFARNKISAMLAEVQLNIHQAPERARYAMNQFIYTVGISYLPLHQVAIEIAAAVGAVAIQQNNAKIKLLNAHETILKAADKGRLGFKRKYVRC